MKTLKMKKKFLQMVMVIKQIWSSLKNFVSNLQFISKPDYWLMNYPFDKEWDDELNSLLTNYPFTDIGDYHAKLGSTNIWIRNHPYASFRKSASGSYRPSRLTILKAKKLLDRQIELMKGDVNFDRLISNVSHPFTDQVDITYRPFLYEPHKTTGSIRVEIKNTFKKK
jgi:hypothetical protein